MTTTANDVAAYVMTRIACCEAMTLQRLVYYCQGWSLAWDDEPMFSEPIQAWANGPVIYEIFEHHQGEHMVRTWPFGDPNALTEDQRETVDVVVSHYGRFSGQELSDMSHEERPWVEARDGLAIGARSQKALDLATMKEFFSELAAESEESK